MGWHAPCGVPWVLLVFPPFQPPMKITSIQPTPNPNAYKFVLEQRVVRTGVEEYGNAAEAERDPLARTLFGVPDVENVFLCENFVTVTMKDGADWRKLNEGVSQVLTAHQPPAAQVPGAQVAAAGSAAAGLVDKVLSAGDQDLLGRINDVLDDRVRPALAGDGGGLQVLGLEGKTLKIRYQGACGSCPSSIAGTLMAIENMLQTEVDEEIQVVSA